MKKALCFFSACDTYSLCRYVIRHLVSIDSSSLPAFLFLSIEQTMYLAFPPFTSVRNVLCGSSMMNSVNLNIIAHVCKKKMALAAVHVFTKRFLFHALWTCFCCANFLFKFCFFSTQKEKIVSKKHCRVNCSLTRVTCHICWRLDWNLFVQNTQCFLLNSMNSLWFSVSTTLKKKR